MIEINTYDKEKANAHCKHILIFTTHNDMKEKKKASNTPHMIVQTFVKVRHNIETDRQKQETITASLRN